MSVIGRLERHGLGVLGLVLAALALIAAVAAPAAGAHDPVKTRLRGGPQAAGTPGHPLGTDQLGRDLLSRVLYGARVALFIGLCTVLLTAVVGGLLGLLAGFFGGLARRGAHAHGRRAALVSRSSCSRSPSTPSWASGCATSSSVCPPPAGSCMLASSVARCCR